VNPSLKDKKKPNPECNSFLPLCLGNAFAIFKHKNLSLNNSLFKGNTSPECSIPFIRAEELIRGHVYVFLKEIHMRNSFLKCRYLRRQAESLKGP
jgi:hypothetical protein